MKKNAEISPREKLLIAGITEIQQYGVQNFSVRRVAAACGVSCTAPYKHFDGKLAFIRAIVDYVFAQWSQKCQEIIAACHGSTREQIVEVSIGFIKFLHENPQMRSLIMLRDLPESRYGQMMLLQISDTSRSLVDEYCRSVNMPEDVKVRKTFLVRSVIYGAVLMLDNGELELDGSWEQMVRFLISREFDAE